MRLPDNETNRLKLLSSPFSTRYIHLAMVDLAAPETTREGLLAELDFRRVEASAKLDVGRRSKLGQFLTPVSIAEFMASLLRERPQSLRILDAGAGIGSLAAACVSAASGWKDKPQRIEVTAYEVEHA